MLPLTLLTPEILPVPFSTNIRGSLSDYYCGLLEIWAANHFALQHAFRFFIIGIKCLGQWSILRDYPYNEAHQQG